MKTQLERAREKHAELVKQHARCHDNYNKKMDAAFRYRTKIQQTERAIARSQKRLDLLMAAAVHTNGPTASPVPELVELAGQTVKRAPVVLNDPIPDMVSDPIPSRNLNHPDVALAQEFNKSRRRKRRTPDNFVADMKAKQL